MFLRRARATRLAATCLFFTIALLMVPKADVPETLLDEANASTSEMIGEKAASPWEDRQSMTAFVPRLSAQSGQITVHRILPVYAARLTDSRVFRELLCSFLC
jgi:hypothetical protein